MADNSVLRSVGAAIGSDHGDVTAIYHGGLATQSNFQDVDFELVNATLPWRRINRWENEAVLERMAKQLAARPGVLNVRRETVEHPFGSIKQWTNQGAFLMLGLEKVRGEFILTALAYNIRRAITPIGIPGLIRAVTA